MDAPATDQAEPGRAFFVTLRDEARERVAFLSGPYQSHSLALAAVTKAREKAYEADPSTWWHPIGTAQAPVDTSACFGVL